MNQADLEFARGCQRESQEEGTEVIRWQKRLDSMRDNLVETLMAFLLDTPQNIEQAAICFMFTEIRSNTG